MFCSPPKSNPLGQKQTSHTFSISSGPLKRLARMNTNGLKRISIHSVRLGSKFTPLQEIVLQAPQVLPALRLIVTFSKEIYSKAKTRRAALPEDDIIEYQRIKKTYPIHSGRLSRYRIFGYIYNNLGCFAHSDNLLI